MDEAQSIASLTDVAQARSYTGLLYSFLALRSDGAIQNIVARLVFTATEPPADWTSRVDIGSLRAERGFLPVEAALASVRRLPDGHLALGEISLLLGQEGTARYTWSYADYSPQARRHLKWPGDFLFGSGARQADIGTYELLSSVNRRVLALTDGRFGNLPQLARHLGGTGSPLNIAWDANAHVEVFAPVYARWRGAHLAIGDRSLEAEIEAPSTSVVASTDVFIVHDRLPQPLRYRLADLPSVGEDRRVLREKLPDLTGPFDLHIVTGGYSVDSRQVGLPRLAGQVHLLIDPDWKWLTDLRKSGEQKRSSDAFHHYVATLLHLIGLPAIHYGFSSPNDAPDLVVELDEQTFLIGECKVSLPTTEIVEKLHGWVQTVDEGLGSAAAVSGQVFHAASRDAVSPDVVRAASQRGIKLRGREDLRELHLLLGRGEPREVLVATLLA